MYYVYILKSSESGKYYVGETDNIDRRLNQHITGKSSFGKRNKGIKLVHVINVNTLGDAKRLEYFLKKQKSHTFISKVINGKISVPL